MKEQLANLCHEQWSGWMEYLFSKGEFMDIDGTWVMPAWAVERWKHQMNTPYEQLSEEEKDSDRTEADKFLALLPGAITQPGKISRGVIKMTKDYTHEPFDYNGAIRESAQLMLAEVVKPENTDLMEAIKGVGSHDGPGGNFMFGFTSLSREQTTRWDAIVEIGDKHGHSGASYGFACRHLQTLLAEI